MFAASASFSWFPKYVVIKIKPFFHCFQCNIHNNIDQWSLEYVFLGCNSCFDSYCSTFILWHAILSVCSVPVCGYLLYFGKTWHGQRTQHGYWDVFSLKKICSSLVLLLLLCFYTAFLSCCRCGLIDVEPNPNVCAWTQLIFALNYKQSILNEWFSTSCMNVWASSLLERLKSGFKHIRIWGLF